MPLPKILSTKKSSADVILCVRALKIRPPVFWNTPTALLWTPQSLPLICSLLLWIPAYTATFSQITERLQQKNTSSLNLSGISKAQFQKLKGNADSSFHSGDKYYNCCTLSNGWLHVTEIPESYIQGNTHILIRALLITVLIFLLLTVIIVILFSENLTRKITALSYAMEAFQLGYDPEHLSIVTVPHPDDPSRYDEIDRLGITFEDMQHTIAGNLKSIVNLSVNEERLKYQLLQSQINPHFLYNILGSIRTCQSLGKLDIADQMIANLTAFYRLTLRKSKELIPIKDELEIARLYLEMEKLCHKDNLDWEIEAEDGIENFLICKFTLQPFLENSILHGISSGTPAVFISIHVLYGDDTVVISIEDNGAGMDSETLAQLRHAIEHNVIDYEKHFGISNVSSRISNPLYGNGSVRIRSNPGNGTYVTIEFEQMEEDIDEKIMIVDDNYLSAEGIEKNIDWETLNAEIIHVCYNGTSAIEAMKKEPADLIISDIEMPDLDGISMSRQALEINPMVKIILISAYDKFEYARRALLLGALDYIEKPLDYAYLIQKVKTLLH